MYLIIQLDTRSEKDIVFVDLYNTTKGTNGSKIPRLVINMQ